MIMRDVRVIAILLSACLVVLLYLPWYGCARFGKDLQDKFFAAVESGDISRISSMFDPGLSEKVDSPVLAAWLKAFRETLGHYHGSAVSTVSKFADAKGKWLEIRGMGRFERGRRTVTWFSSTES